MEVVVAILLAVLVLAVAIDMIARMERKPPRDPAAATTTQKIIVDLSKRR
jgi:hypothetical protein